MSVRNYSDIGENARLIIERLMANPKLMRLLVYTDKDPFGPAKLISGQLISGHYDVTKDFIEKNILNEYIKIVPRITPDEVSHPIIVLRFDTFLPNLANKEFKDVTLNIVVSVPLEQWAIKNENLRPFLIMGEIENSLRGKTVNGLGRIESAGAQVNFFTDEIGQYQMTYIITSYD